MNKEFKNNSLVIVANNHNPSLLSDYFLLTSEIIKNEDEIDRSTLILTPAFAQVTLDGNINISIDPEKLAITSPIGAWPFEIGKKYCDTLKFIKGIAIGINFDLELSDFNFEDWFSKKDLSKESRCVESRYLYKDCIITISLMKNGNAATKFNFHYSLPKDLSLGEIKLDFLAEWKKNQGILEEFLSSNF